MFCAGLFFFGGSVEPIENPYMAFDFDSPAAFQEWFSAVDNVLLDCDGVLWAGSSPIPGAAAAVARMRHAGKRVFFVVRF